MNVQFHDLAIGSGSTLAVTAMPWLSSVGHFVGAVLTAVAATFVSGVVRSYMERRKNK